MSRHWTSIKCSEIEVCIKLVVLVRNYGSTYSSHWTYRSFSLSRSVQVRCWRKYGFLEMFFTKRNYVNKTFEFKFFHTVTPTLKFKLPVYYTVYVIRELEHVTIQRHIWDVSDPFKARGLAHKYWDFWSVSSGLPKDCWHLPIDCKVTSTYFLSWPSMLTLPFGGHHFETYICAL
jgi:hypothetical protein